MYNMTSEEHQNRSAAIKRCWADPNSIYRSKEYQEKQRIAQTGRCHSSETKRKMSKTAHGKLKPPGYAERESIARMGEGNPNYGKHRSEQWKREQSERIKLLYQKGVKMGSFSPSLGKKPSGLERKLIAFFEKYSLDFKYCGSGTLIIGGKCPDFCHNLFKNRLVEVGNIDFYKVFDLSTTKRKYTQRRQRHFEKYGFQTLVIWEEELFDESKLLNKVLTFATGV